MQNGYIERFNRHYREDILDAYYFGDVHQLQKLSDKWRLDYNYNHPHQSLNNKSPIEHKSRFDEEVNFFIKEQLNKNFLSNFKVSYFWGSLHKYYNLYSCFHYNFTFSNRLYMASFQIE